MLTKTSISAAQQLSTILAGKGLYLSPLPNTPLEEAVKCSLLHVNVDSQTPVESRTNTSFADLLVEGSLFTDPTGTCDHDVVLEGSVKVVGESIKFNLDLAKNTVNPMVNNLVEQITKYSDQLKQQIRLPVTIEPYFTKPIISSPVLASMVQNYASIPFVRVQLKSLNVERPVSFRETVMTGASSIDAEIMDFIDSIGGDKVIEELWNIVFSKSTMNFTDLGQLIEPHYINDNNAVILFLISRRYHSDVPEGTDMDLSQWQLYMSSIRSQCGRAINAIIKRKNTVNELNVLVAKNNTIVADNNISGFIVVNGEVWNRWLKSGGTPELLLGAALVTYSFDYKSLLANKETYERGWANYFSLLKSKQDADTFSELVKFTKVALNDAKNSIPEDKRMMEENTIKTYLGQNLANLRPEDFNDLHRTMRRIVCKSFFRYTDAEKILVGIENVTAKHPDMDIREAALLATIDYVSEWVCKSFEVLES